MSFTQRWRNRVEEDLRKLKEENEALKKRVDELERK